MPGSIDITDTKIDVARNPRISPRASAAPRLCGNRQPQSSAILPPAGFANMPGSIDITDTKIDVALLPPAIRAKISREKVVEDKDKKPNRMKQLQLPVRASETLRFFAPPALCGKSAERSINRVILQPPQRSPFAAERLPICRGSIGGKSRLRASIIRNPFAAIEPPAEISPAESRLLESAQEDRTA